MIKLSHVDKTYALDGGQFPALTDINLEISAGEFSAIIGPSGSGKSTLMHLLGLLDRPTIGKIFIEEKEVSRLSDQDLSRLRNEFVGFVFQQFNLLPRLTVRENILLPAIYSRRHQDYAPKDKANYLLGRFGIADKSASFPNQLSGGQQQRVAIARALITNPRLILADEPTGNLDTRTGEEIMKLLRELNKQEKITVVIVTHEPNIAAYAKRKIHLRDGKIVP
jgi:putative ABC transport system ATP-binding protein